MNVAQVFPLARQPGLPLGNQAPERCSAFITKPGHDRAQLRRICERGGSGLDEQPARHQHASQRCSAQSHCTSCTDPTLLPRAGFSPSNPTSDGTSWDWFGLVFFYITHFTWNNLPDLFAQDVFFSSMALPPDSPRGRR